MNFEHEYNKRVDLVDSYLNGYFIRRDNKFVETINKAMRYSFTAAGKRLRPILLMEFSRLFGNQTDHVLDFAASIEMIHTYSLIHDDLPAMDNDELRRGKPTNHIVFGEAVAILAGDALLNYAFENMIQCALNDPINAVKYLEAMKIIGEASGHKGMILGQVADLMNEGKAIDLDALDFINRNKTGELLKAAMMAGAVLGGCSREQLATVEKIGYNVGQCFQIVDDILDIEGDAKTMGKPQGSDEKNHKATYPTLLGIEASKQKVVELLDSSVELLNTLDGDKTIIEALIRFIGEREK